MLKTIRLLRQHCLSSDGEILLEVRSNPVALPAAVNSMDPCVAVSLPVFVIHGGHDQPTVQTGTGRARAAPTSSLHLLAQAGLVTYFGQSPCSTNIEVAPILLQKGQKRLALYGLGNVSDERHLHLHLDVEGCHKDVDELNDRVPWFNVFVLHQNCATGRSSTRGIPGTLLPAWLNYVVLGHEHESKPDVRRSKPVIVQPGSTVATSLSAREAKQKHAILLEIHKEQLVKHVPITLYTVRNLHVEDIILSAQSGLSQTDPEGLNKCLEDTVNDIIERQQAFFDRVVAIFRVRQPLIILRVETTGKWQLPNPTTFGQTYIGRVASPGDMLQCYRSEKENKLRRQNAKAPFQRKASAMASQDEEGLPRSRRRGAEIVIVISDEEENTPFSVGVSEAFRRKPSPGTAE
ncbi:unnamed protein product [Chondrus crispus]|uniref:Mre11 DNA-binding domain-containing protein n=1 Tax=Chondrus crispus TaxID=2769 RepID=R7Q893_CHOCR|nr:unnamed protein product [Chondrus crispus]CDF34259.1 unnamed protein product [Chondrus crispus]|eukprot:XP_005714078.1 unnamed protein product [Chondrus crispus]